MQKQGPGKIGYVDWTWNPVTGCYYGCSYCFAHFIAQRFQRHHTGPAQFAVGRDLAVATTRIPFPAGFVPTFYPYRLDEPTRVKRPSRILVCDMADLFGDWVPEQWVREVLRVIRQTHWHTFLCLTKNPVRYAKFDWPENCWLGTTVTKQADVWRIPALLWAQATLHWVSVEPMLGPVDLLRVPVNYGEGLFGDPFTPHHVPHSGRDRVYNTLGLVVCGGQTGPASPPLNPDWVRGLQQQCEAAKVSFYLKSWGEWAPWSGLEDDDCPCGRHHDIGEQCDKVHFWRYTGGGPAGYEPRGVSLSVRVGRKAAGRLLDGKECTQLPSPRGRNA